MHYKSTRDSGLSYTASQVIAQGISEEGGLFVPAAFPDVKPRLSQWAELSYCELAEKILALFLTDFTQEEIHDCVQGAYGSGKFEGDQPVTLKNLAAQKSVLELWHGPTSAFKDMALQLLPRLLSVAMKKTGDKKTAFILVATSGDTGKAALEGFRDVPGTKVVSFYPAQGVSPMQQRQMVTQEGENLCVCSVTGNFDDSQTGVKKIFTDPKMEALAAKNDLFFSSANSINFGRLLPQIIYYFYGYFRLYRDGRISALGEAVNVAVPTGNFGNILAGYYAARMGLPLKRFICASNANNVLTQFIRTGCYDRRRAFYTTMSPSMDILISSNLERLLYHLSGEDSGQVADWMAQLAEKGVYQVTKEVQAALAERFYGEDCTDPQTASAIETIYREEGYLSDPHTAVAFHAQARYQAQTGDEAPVMLLSTASPYKFSDHVLEALGQPVDPDPFRQLADLEAFTGVPAQLRLKSLKDKKIRFRREILPGEMSGFVSDFLEDWQVDS